MKCSKRCAVWWTWWEGCELFGMAYCRRGWHIVGPLDTTGTKRRARPAGGADATPEQEQK